MLELDEDGCIALVLSLCGINPVCDMPNVSMAVLLAGARDVLDGRAAAVLAAPCFCALLPPDPILAPPL